MELWIRSQDKQSLMLCKRITIIDNVDNCVINADSSTWDYDIGIYKTEERALEVLDEIQDKIKTHLYLKSKSRLKLDDIAAAKRYFEKLNGIDFIACDNNFEIIPITSNVIVYEMPEN